MPQTCKKQVGIDSLMVSSATTKTEIRCVLNMVCSRYSKNSSWNVNGLFEAMFSDSVIAKNFQCGFTKASYVTTLLPTSIGYCYKRSFLCHIK